MILLYYGYLSVKIDLISNEFETAFLVGPINLSILLFPFNVGIQKLQKQCKREIDNFTILSDFVWCCEQHSCFDSSQKANTVSKASCLCGI